MKTPPGVLPAPLGPGARRRSACPLARGPARQPCAVEEFCGDGIVQAISRGEQCDDANTLSGDGCNVNCAMADNWECPTPGQPCDFLIVCGNGRTEIGEACDDNNTTDGDVCAAARGDRVHNSTCI